jgi:hypothetical protein
MKEKWWSRSREELKKIGNTKRRDFGHIDRIIETELREKLEGGRRCAACQAADEECWVYSEKGAKQVKKCGLTCARCRVAACSGGCSLSTQRQRCTPSPPPPRGFAALRPAGGPPPGAEDSGIAV